MARDWRESISSRNSCSVSQTAVRKAVPDRLLIGAAVGSAISVDERFACIDVARIVRSHLQSVGNQLQHDLVSGWYTVAVGCNDPATHFPKGQRPNLANV